MMNSPQKKENKMFKTLFNQDLLIVQCERNRIQFTLFNFAHQDILNQTEFLLTTLKALPSNSKYPKTLPQVFLDIKMNPDEMISFSDYSITLKVKLSKDDKPLFVDLPLVKNQLTPTQSIAYIKQYSQAKEHIYKTEILRLKSKIYSLMTDVEDATNLIRSQSIQKKSTKEQIKSLKEQLKLLQNQKKKQQKNFVVDVGVQHSYSTQVDDIIESLKKPEMKQFSLDQEKLKNLTTFIEQQIKVNENMLFIANETLPQNQKQSQKYLSERKITWEPKEDSPEAETTHFSPQNVRCCQKPASRFKLEDYSMKTLELI